MLFHHARYLAMATVCIVRYLWVYTVYMSDYWQAWRLSNILPCNSSSDSFLATMPAPPSSYKSLIKTSLKVGGYSELLHMYAASAAFGIVIQSRNPTCHPAMRLASELILTLDLSSAVVCTGLHCSVSCGQCQQFRVYCSIVYCI